MPFLPLDLNYVTAEIIQKAADEIGESPKVKKEKLIELRQKIKEIPSLVCPVDENFLLMFLRPSKYDVKKAAERIQNFYFEMMKNKEIFGNIDFEIIKTLCEQNFMNILPFRDADGCVIIILSIDRFEFDKMRFSALLMAVTVQAVCLVNRCTATQICGLKYIVDIKNIGVRHLKYLPLKHIILLARGLTGLLPIRYKAVHFLNPSPALQFSRNIANFVLSEKIRKRVLFHPSEDLPKYFDPRILPKTYGGKLECNNKFLLEKLPEFKRRSDTIIGNN